MSCESMRATMRATVDGDWPREVVDHLATCDACVDAAIDLALRRQPATTVPSSFAVDVARRARVDVPVPPGVSRGMRAALAGSILGVLIPAVWLLLAGFDRAVLPITALLLGCAEGTVLFAWTTQTDVVRPKFGAR